MQPPKTYHQYKSAMPSMRYIFANGKVANFVKGQYLTDIKSEIEELDKELEIGNPYIFKDSAKPTVTSEDLDPLAVIKKKVIEEYLAAQGKQNDVEQKDFGNTGAPKVNSTGLVTSKTVASVSK